MRSISQDQFESNMLRGVRGKYFRSALKRVLREREGCLSIRVLEPYTVELRIDGGGAVRLSYANGIIDMTASDGAFCFLSHGSLTYGVLKAFANP